MNIPPLFLRLQLQQSRTYAVSVGRGLCVAVFCVVSLCSAFGQKKEIADAQSYIKGGKEVAKAVALMDDLLKNPEHKTNKKVYLTLYAALEKQYAMENEKAYLKQKYDTALLFNAAKRMFGVLESLDSVDATPDRKGTVKPKYRKKHAAWLMRIRPNLYYGGNFFVRKEKWKDAVSFYETYLDCAEQPLFAGQNISVNDTLSSQAAYWASYASYMLSDADGIIFFSSKAKPSAENGEHLLRFLASAWGQKDNEEKRVAVLKEGFERYPQSRYFFTRLVDYYNANKHPELALDCANKGIAVCDTCKLFLFAKSTALLNMNMYEECVAASDRLIALDPHFEDSYFNAGTALLNRALGLETLKTNAQDKKEIQKCYERALPYMEKYRELAPAEKDKWVAGLYRIYLNLNMGKQFNEIDKLMK